MEPDSVSAAAATVIDLVGAPDALVHNAGVAVGSYSTDLTHDGAPVYRDDAGPYRVQHPKVEKRGRFAVSVAKR